MISAPISSMVIDRFSCRVAMVAAGLCYIVGNIATAFAPNIYVAIVTFGIIAGMSESIITNINLCYHGINVISLTVVNISEKKQQLAPRAETYSHSIIIQLFFILNAFLS